MIAVLLVRMGVAYFNREELLGRELDTLNPQWAWKVFRRAFVGQASSIGEWFSSELMRALSGAWPSRRRSWRLLLVVADPSSALRQAQSAAHTTRYFDQATLYQQFTRWDAKSMPFFSVKHRPHYLAS